MRPLKDQCAIPTAFLPAVERFATGAHEQVQVFSMYLLRTPATCVSRTSMHRVADIAVIVADEDDSPQTLFLLSDLAFDVFLETGLKVQPLVLPVSGWVSERRFTRPALVQSIKANGIQLEFTSNHTKGDDMQTQPFLYDHEPLKAAIEHFDAVEREIGPILAHSDVTPDAVHQTLAKRDDALQAARRAYFELTQDRNGLQSCMCASIEDMRSVLMMAEEGAQLAALSA
jgi:hypothetical protein